MRDALIVISSYAANYGGNFVRSIRALACAYDGPTVFVLPDEARGKSWVGELSGYEVEFASFNRQGLYRACAGLAARYGKDALVHTHFVGGFLFAQVARCFDRIVCHQHMAVDHASSLKDRAKAAAKKILFGRLYSKAVLVAVSEPVADSLRFAYPKVKVECVPNAIDFSRYADCVAEVADRPSDPVRALVFGTHFKRKAVDVAMDACERLIEQGKGVVLTVPVHNPQECAEEVIALRGEVPSWVRIVPVTEDVASLYASADLFLSPSRSEAFGYAVVEAAYMGCGVVASDVPGQNSLKGIDGIQWVQPEDSEGLANAMVASAELLSSRTCDDLDALRAELEKQYGIERWTADMLEVYASCDK